MNVQGFCPSDGAALMQAADNKHGDADAITSLPCRECSVSWTFLYASNGGVLFQVLETDMYVAFTDRLQEVDTTLLQQMAGPLVDALQAPRPPNPDDEGPPHA